MSAGLLRRVAAIEQRLHAHLPPLPVLLLRGDDSDHDRQRAEFLATHGRPPELVIVLRIVRPQHTEET